MIEEPQIVDIKAQYVATIHIETPRSKMQEVMGPGISEAISAAQSQGIGPVGPFFTHHFKITPDAFNFDICVPVSQPAKAVGRVKPWERAALKVVRTVYHGSYDGLGGAWHEFADWIEAHKLQTASDLFEAYLVGPESSSNPEDWRTELYRAVVE